MHLDAELGSIYFDPASPFRNSVSSAKTFMQSRSTRSASRLDKQGPSSRFRRATTVLALPTRSGSSRTGIPSPHFRLRHVKHGLLAAWPVDWDRVDDAARAFSGSDRPVLLGLSRRNWAPVMGSRTPHDPGYPVCAGDIRTASPCALAATREATTKGLNLCEHQISGRNRRWQRS